MHIAITLLYNKTFSLSSIALGIQESSSSLATGKQRCTGLSLEAGVPGYSSPDSLDLLVGYLAKVEG